MVEMQKSTTKRAEPTQKYLKIAEIRDNVVLLKDGGLRAVIAVSSTNFALKSEEEQSAIAAAYQNFLNSLDFPIQLLIHSRVLDIEGYLEKLRGLAAGQTNELLRIQMSEYIEYVQKLVEYASIMSKTFYVIVPYSAGAVKETMLGRLTKIFNPVAEIATRQEDLEKARAKLGERIDQIVSGLGSMGLRSMVLNTRELIELLYMSYNFESASPLHAEAIEEMNLEG